MESTLMIYGMMCVLGALSVVGIMIYDYINIGKIYFKNTKKDWLMVGFFIFFNLVAWVMTIAGMVMVKKLKKQGLM